MAKHYAKENSEKKNLDILSKKTQWVRENVHRPIPVKQYAEEY